MISRSHKLTSRAVPPSGAGVPGGDPASAAAPGIAPRVGNTGGKSPKVSYDTRTITCHWLRVIHQASDLPRIRAMLVERFGEPDQVRGRWFYEHGERFSNGILLLSGAIASREKERVDDEAQHEGTVCVDVCGSALDDLDSLDRARLCHDLSLGGRVSRLDLAVDAYHRDRVGLIDCIIDSCTKRELCGAKRWEPKASYDGASLVGYGVCIGRRGNLGSGRYLRVYDKGLEAGDRPAGRWERYEVEFSGDCAAEAAVDVFRDVAGWEPRAWARVCGAVSFREDDSSNGELARRSLCAWWKAWIDGIEPLPTVPLRVETTLLRHARWLRETVLPTIARLADSARLPWTDALLELVGWEIKPRANDKYMRSMMDEWRSHLAGWVEHLDGRIEFVGPRRVAAA